MRPFWIACLLLVAQTAFAQVHPEPVTGLPTNELLDLHVDQKGYLWIAHGLGISRYDGLNITNYAHPAQINLRSADILEDHHGRIWFHNFSGQVFYIEKGKVHLLDSYNYLHENQSPRMVLCGNELLITSYKGLFVCNTDQFTTRFYPFERNSATTVVSIAAVHNKAVVYNNLDWYVYHQGSWQKTKVQSPLRLPPENFVSLQPAAFNDTLLLTANPSGELYKLTLETNGVRFASRQAYHDYINAVSVDQEAWVHTRNQSVNLRTGAVIKSLDLTDVVSGKEGNTWYCSRREGLLVRYRPSLWQQVTFQVEADDFIRSLNAHAGYFFAGTQKGTLYTYRNGTARADWTQELFNGLGSIDFIRYIGNDRFVVGSSTDTYVVNARQKKMEALLPIRGVVDVDFDENSFYLATAVGLYVLPLPGSPLEKQQWLQQKKEQFPFLSWPHSNDAYLLLPQGTRSVRYDRLRRRLYASTKNSMTEISREGAHPFRINQKEVYATTLDYKDGRLYIATVNDGLWLADNAHLQHFTTANMLASNTLIRIKATEDHLWLFGKAGIQVLDVHTSHILQNIDLPKIESANVLDVAEKGNMSYLTTTKGVYRVPLNKMARKRQPQGYLDYVIVSGSDTLQSLPEGLSYQKNDVQFHFSSPAFYEPENIAFRYRLKGAETEWRTTSPAERMIRYSLLAPGHYEFELYAINNDGLHQQNSIRFPFTINKPWWRTGWFFILVNLLVVTIIYLVIQNRIQQKLRMEVMRRNISSDLHDDIGATLSSVNFYIDLAGNEKENATYLHQIKENVAHVIASLDDLVWSINPKNDTSEQFIQRMKEYAVPLLKAVSIECQFSYDPRLLQLKLDLLTKRNLYLLFKEMVNNVAKHACCRNCTIQLSYEERQLCLAVKDDGQGFDLAAARPNRNGLFTMQERTRKLKGEIEIKSVLQKGSAIAVTIPV